MKKILFLSTGDSCRSLMAKELVNHIYRTKFVAESAAVDKVNVNDKLYEVMGEIGIDINDDKTYLPEDFENEDFDYVITLCDESRENCPIYWTKGEAKYKHMEIADPRIGATSDDELLKSFRETRDKLEEHLMSFFDKEIRNITF
ncbi:MAG: arsenate reductase ArsC [Candidatus Eremiobacteraeota bacterium]|nr:arsenate reductase ArsC [Candidatus Eremiobacteraeota bacterium]